MNTIRIAILLAIFAAACNTEDPIVIGPDAGAVSGAIPAADAGAAAQPGPCPNILPLVYGITPCTETTGTCYREDDATVPATPIPNSAVKDCSVGAILCVAACP